MTAAILQFPREKIVRIAPARQEDVRTTFARHVEHAFGSDVDLIDKWAAAKSYLHGSYDKIGEAES